MIPNGHSINHIKTGRKRSKAVLRLKAFIWLILFLADLGSDIWNGFVLWKNCHFYYAYCIWGSLSLPGVCYGLDVFVQAFKTKDCLKLVCAILAPLTFYPSALWEILMNIFHKPNEETMDDARL